MASGDTLLIWNALGNEPPATGYATINVRNGHPVLEFDAATTEGGAFSGILPRTYQGGGLTVYLHWMGAAATSGNVVWGTAIERMNTDLDSDSFATQQTATGAANATSGIETVTSIAHSSGANMDGAAAGDAIRLQVQRLGGDAGDTMTGDAQLLLIEVKET